jgi:glycosyltransferase involved in cell wall biosynthesis
MIQNQRYLLGYLIPEFPGQTHIFFRRELDALQELGISPFIISTRLPPPALMSHTWSEEARKSTTYLFPPSTADLLGSLWELLRSGPLEWFRTARTILSCETPVLAAKFLIPGAQLKRLCRKNGLKHVHVHSCANAAHLALIAHALGGPSYSLTLHGPLKDYGPNQQAKWAQAAFVIVITRKLLAEVQEQLGAGIAAKASIAPMGADVKRFLRTEPYLPWDGSGVLRLFCCARLTPIKGYEELIDAVGALKKSGVPVELRIAGEDDAGGSGYRRTLEERIAQSEAGASIRLLGAVNEQTIIDELHAAHLFVLASHHEPLGVAIMEAMAAGIPVITTNAGGVPELITSGVHGLLVPPKSPEELARTIRKLAEEPALAKALSDAALERVQQHFHSGVSAEVLRKQLCKQTENSAGNIHS